MDFNVIIKIDANNVAKYKALFTKAYRALDAKGLVKPEFKNDEGRFQNLDEYFAHMSALETLEHGKYLLLPLDETPFAINANTRTITAPKIVALQNDQLAETLVFTIDRYVDYMDLCNATIFVQWTLPDGETQGASEVELIDMDSEPGKIRFGWTLDDEITSQPGTVQFSVRFWIKDPTNEDKVVYSLNTITSSITITKSLQVNINSEEEINRPKQSSLFKKAIRDSVVITENRPAPAAPLFENPGLDLPLTAALKDNTLLLRAQAFVTDTGVPSYEWYYQPAENITIVHPDDEDISITYSAQRFYSFNDVEDVDDKGEPITIYGFKHLGGHKDPIDKLNGTVYEVVNVEKGAVLPAFENFYTLDADNNATPYASTTAPTDDTKLYQKYSVYEVPTGNVKVAGRYKVEAYNSNAYMTQTSVSTVCTLPVPDAVEFKTDLAKVKVNESGTGVALSVQTNKPTAGEIVYQWSKSTTSDTTGFTDIPDATDYSFTAEEPGWYKVHASIELNRANKEATSAVCKVTNLPVAPVLVYNEDVTIPEGDTIAEFVGNEAVLTAVVNNADSFKSPLYSDGINYVWYYSKPDSSKFALLPADGGQLDPGVIVTRDPAMPHVITVSNPAHHVVPYMFKCVAINVLSEKTKDSNELFFRVR